MAHINWQWIRRGTLSTLHFLTQTRSRVTGLTGTPGRLRAAGMLQLETERGLSKPTLLENFFISPILSIIRFLLSRLIGPRERSQRFLVRHFLAASIPVSLRFPINFFIYLEVAQRYRKRFLDISSIRVREL